MMTFFALCLFVFLIFNNRSLSRRLEFLERKFNDNAGIAPVKNSGVAPVPWQTTPVNIPPPMAAAAPMQTRPSEYAGEDKLTAWFKEDWLMKLGILVFILGFAWFISYAFANNWIGPIGRITLGIFGGLLIMTFGFHRMLKYLTQGAIFMALGAAMVMLTIFAGRSIYHFFTPSLAVLFDFAVVAFVSFASYKFNIKNLAFLAQILAFVTPLLVAGESNSVFLFSYLFFISLATLVLASITGWRDLITSSLIFVGFYSIPYMFLSHGLFGSNKFAQDAPLILNFAYVFSMLYLFSGMFAVIKKGVQDSKNEIMLAALNGIFLFLWIWNVAPAEWHSLIYAAWAVVFSVASFFAFKLSSNIAPFYAYAGVATAFIGAATAAQLDGADLVIAFAIEILLMVISILYLTNKTGPAVSAAWLFLIPMFLSFQNMLAYGHASDLFTADFFALATVAAALIVSGRFISQFVENKDKKEVDAPAILIIAGTVYIGYILWQFIHILISYNADMATMITLIIYTILGLMAYFNGLYQNDIARRTYGAALLIFVVIRLLLVDVWHMALFGRVVTFLAIGILLMSTAFLTKHKRKEITGNNPSNA